VFAADAPVLSIQITTTPIVSSSTHDQIEVRLSYGEIEGFAIISEPSHTLIGVVLNNDKNSNVANIENSDWFATDVLPFFVAASDLGLPRDVTAAAVRAAPGGYPIRINAPLRSGATVVFLHGRRAPSDDRLIFSMVGDVLETWNGSRIVRATLAAKQRPSALVQTFSLRGSVDDALSPLAFGDAYNCGCGSNQPRPCGSGGSGSCGCCKTCTEKRDGPYCVCGLVTSGECGWCGKSECYCTGFPPSC